MKTRPAWLSVALREIYVKITNKAFIVGIVSTLVMLGVGGGLGWYFTTRAQDMTVAVVDAQAKTVATQVIDEAKTKDASLQGRVELYDSTDAALSALANGDADVLMQQNQDSKPGWTLTYQEDSSSIFEGYFSDYLRTQTLNKLADQAGMSMDDVNAQMSFQTKLVDPPQGAPWIVYVVSAAFSVLFWMSSLMYGMQIATSVIEEKQSRIVEILVSVIPVRALLAGKVVGNTILAFGQMLLIGIVAMCSLSFTPLTQMLPHFSSSVIWFLLFFLTGFLALACVWAGAGAMGTRSEDLQQTSQPLTWLLLLVYLAGFIAKGMWQVILSYVPIVSAILMPVRIASGDVSWWQPLIALGLNLVFAVLMVLLGEKIYRHALLRTGSRLSYRQALRLKD